MSYASVLREVGAIALAAGAGWVLLRRYAPTLPGSLRLGLAWPVGSGIVSAAALACVLTGAPLTLATIGPLLALGVAALPNRTDSREGGTRMGATEQRAGIATGLVLAIGTMAALGYRLTAPFPGWDGAGIWGLKSRALLLGSLPAADPLTAYSHPEYPLHVPLVAAWLGAARGTWTDGALLSVCWAGYVALALLLAHAARSRAGSLAWLVIAGIVPLGGLLSQVTQGTADLTLAAFVAGLILCLQRWLQQEDHRALWLAAFLTGLAAWTKFEGVVLGGLAWVAVAAVSSACGRRRSHLVLPAAVAAAIAAPWYVGLLLRQLPLDSMSLTGADRLARLPLIGEAFVAELITLERWGLLWVAAAIGLAVALARRDRRGALPAVVLLGGAAAYAAVYLAAPHPAVDVVWYLRASLPRVLIPLVPAAALLVAGGASELWDAVGHGRSANRQPRHMKSLRDSSSP